MDNHHVLFERVVCSGCGLDVHKDNVVATIKGMGIKEETRTFSTFTSSLRELSQWLKANGITHIAMESTGVYWKPVHNILDSDFEIILVNARHIKHVPGHKTDRKDSAWIAKLLLSGLLKGSFILPRRGRELRDLYRYKRKLIGQRVSECNRVQKVLEDANIKIGSVLSDVFGASGRAMIDAIIEGQGDPKVLAELAKGSLRRKKEQLILALEGNVTDHHRFMLTISRTAIANINALIARVDQQIETYLAAYEEQYRLLQTIPGVQHETTTAIIAEMGTDMSAFPNQHHLASWAGLCPGNNESAGKKKSERITHGNRSLKTALVEAAWVAVQNKDTYLKRRYRGLAARRGKKKALVAIAHKILTAAYFILKDKVPYQEPDNAAWLEKRKQALIRSYLKRLHELGASAPSQIVK
jgi:transposase